MKKLLRPIALSLLWLSIGLSCKKDEPAIQYCDDGTCCNTTNEKFELAGRVEGTTGDFRDSTFLSIGARFPPKSDCATSTAYVCKLSLEKVRGVRLSQDQFNPEHKYRIWGTVYYIQAQTFTCRPILFINIDRLEEIK